MEPNGWTVKIAWHDNESEILAVAEAIRSLVMPLDGPEHGEIESVRSIAHLRGVSSTLVVIPSVCESTLKQFLEELLIIAYAQKDGDTELGLHRFLFLSVGPTSMYYEGARRILKNLGVGQTTVAYGDLPSLAKLLRPNSQRISSSHVRQAIEDSGFASGASELQELLFRDKVRLHEILGGLGIGADDPRYSAIRMLLGAFAAGDVPQDSVVHVLKRLVEGDKNWENMQDWLDEICQKQSKLQIHASNRCCLSAYLSGKHILFIEDQCEEQSWDVVLPTLFGSEGEIDGFEQRFGNVSLTHVRTAREALVKCQVELHKFDIILLDLYSSENPVEASGPHPVNASSVIGLTISEPVKQLVDCVRSLYKREAHIDRKTTGNAGLDSTRDWVPTSLPRIVVFSRDATGLSARTMLKEFGASDYFFKWSQGEAHKGTYYCSFRNALITALKENVAHVLGLPIGQAKSKLDSWLGQFFPSHRPEILSVMKHFRYYSARSIVNVLDRYLIANTTLRGGNIVSFRDSPDTELEHLWFSYLGRPNKSGPPTLALVSKTEWLRRCRSNILENKGEPIKELPQFKTYEKLIEDLACELVTCRDQKGKRIIVIFVDDVIVSGGQLETYAQKFIADKLQGIVKDISFKTNFGGSWERVCKILGSKANHDESSLKVELHALFAIGINNRTLKKEVLGHFETVPATDKLTRYPPKSGEGLFHVEVCFGNAGRIRIPFHVHIADYTDNMGSVCEREKIDPVGFEELLMNYVFITNPRENEYHCDFEPLGWEKCGGLIATYANTPGNTLPIIWGDGGATEWTSLFPRFFNPWPSGASKKPVLVCQCNPDHCKLSVPDPDTLWRSLESSDYTIKKEKYWCKNLRKPEIQK